MKANMSGFDLRAIVGELSQYVGAYVKKSYMPHYEQIVPVSYTHLTLPTKNEV